MIMASHRTFSSQIDHLSGQIKFGQTNLIYIINGEVIEFTKENECPDNFQSYHKHCIIAIYVHVHVHHIHAYLESF